MRILFSTGNTLNHFDFDSGVLATIAEGPQELFGISGDSTCLVLSHSGIDCESLKTHADYVASPQGVLSVTRQDGSRQTTEPWLLQPHQIECHAGSVLCANSGRNCLTVFDSALRPRDIFPTTAHWDIGPGERKNSHFNSVHVQDNLVYVVAHNYARYSTVWVFEWPGFALVDVIPTRSEWAHNILVLPDDMVVCNSKACTLYSVEAKEDIWRFGQEKYMTRALAANEECLIVGLSGMTSRGNRLNSHGGFCVLDRKTLRTLETYLFHEIGNVHEIRLLDEVDVCHGEDILRLPPVFDLAKGAEFAERYPRVPINAA